MVTAEKFSKGNIQNDSTPSLRWHLLLGLCPRDLEAACSHFLGQRNMRQRKRSPTERQQPRGLYLLCFSDSKEEFGLRSVHSSLRAVQTCLAPGFWRSESLKMTNDVRVAPNETTRRLARS